MKNRRKRLGDIRKIIAEKTEAVQGILPELDLPYHDGPQAIGRRNAFLEMLSHLLPHEELEDWKYPVLEAVALLADLGRIDTASEDGPVFDAESSVERALALFCAPVRSGRPGTLHIRFARSHFFSLLRHWEKRAHGRATEIPNSSMTQKMLILSDMFHFTEGTEHFLDSAYRSVEEYPWKGLFRSDGFLDEQNALLGRFIRHMVDGLSDAVDREYHRHLDHRLRDTLRGLKALRDDPSGRKSVQERLDEIRERCGEESLLPALGAA